MESTRFTIDPHPASRVTYWVSLALLSAGAVSSSVLSGAWLDALPYLALMLAMVLAMAAAGYLLERRRRTDIAMRVALWASSCRVSSDVSVSAVARVLRDLRRGKTTASMASTSGGTMSSLRFELTSPTTLVVELYSQPSTLTADQPHDRDNPAGGFPRTVAAPAGPRSDSRNDWLVRMVTVLLLVLFGANVCLSFIIRDWSWVLPLGAMFILIWWTTHVGLVDD